MVIIMQKLRLMHGRIDAEVDLAACVDTVVVILVVDKICAIFSSNQIL